MLSYQSLIREVLENGVESEDRTGTGTIRIFGAMFKHNLATGFPAVTTKKLAYRAMSGELACFLKGHTDVREFRNRGCKIWDANLAKAFGPDETDLGPIYGAQWRNFNGVDQLYNVLKELRNNPNSRRLMVTAWNPGQLEDMCLPPCITQWQLSVIDDRLNLAYNQRSCDLMLGFPFDVAEHALLAHLICHETGLKPGTLTAFLGDCHIYKNHVEAAVETLNRMPHRLPQIIFNTPIGTEVEKFEPQDFELINYVSHPAIKLEMSA